MTTRAPRRVLLQCALVPITVLPASQPASGQCPGTEIHTLVASDTSAGDLFGESVAMDGGVIVVGAPKPNRLGAIYFFRDAGTTWVEEALRTPSDGALNTEFGQAVALRGSVAVVGAPRRIPSGAAYVFVHDGSTWNETQTLRPTGTSSGEFYGCAVDLDAGWIVVGAARDYSLGVQTGAAFVYSFEGSAWVEDQKLFASDPDQYDDFGQSVAVHGDVILVGSRRDDAAATDSGSVYVFRHDGANWIEEAKLVDPSGSDFATLGDAVDLEGDLALAGASGDDVALLFEHSGGGSWGFLQRLCPSSYTTQEAFGLAVSLDQNSIAITNQGDDDVGTNSGSMYRFRDDGTTVREVQKLTVSTGTAFDSFGTSVAIRGDRIVAGASSAVGNAGRAYVFRDEPLDLQASAAAVNPGDTLQLSTCGGVAGTIGMLYVTDVNGAPTLLRLGRGGFTGVGQWLVSGTATSGFSGVVIQLQTLGFYTLTSLAFSNPASVTFL